MTKGGIIGHKMSDVMIYTAIFGDYDTLRPIVQRGYSHLCITDHPQDIPGWTFVEPARFASSRRMARRIKALSYVSTDTEYSIWIDGNVVLVADPEYLIDTFLKDTDIAVFAHPVRDCIYQEAAVCKQLGKDFSGIIDVQMDIYHKEEYPERSGLVETRLVLRRHTSDILDFNSRWAFWLGWHSMRDQLSFNYVSWKLKIPYTIIPGISYESDLIEYRPHKRYTA